MADMNVLDLFSGIGGFSLGLERAGFRTVAFCEIEPYARRVLAEHWPEVPCYDDVRTLTAERLKADGISVDVICGGFPCQDISVAGRGAGLAGERSGLWFEYLRIIKEIRPAIVIIENVPVLRSRGLDEVLRGIASIGYDAEWHCIPASAIGAPHRRDRVWIIAYPAGVGCAEGRERGLTDCLAWLSNAPRWNPTNPNGMRKLQSQGGKQDERGRNDNRNNTTPAFWGSAWTDEPALCGVDDGIRDGMDAGLFALGNAVVPQIPEIIGRAIMECGR
jgi:DNA (cytosine-5)-methyltransferase 1